MKITYLGTAAAEAIPALFCNCEWCRRAAANGGKDVRTRSQALIDDCLLSGATVLAAAGLLRDLGYCVSDFEAAEAGFVQYAGKGTIGA